MRLTPHGAASRPAVVRPARAPGPRHGRGHADMARDRRMPRGRLRPHRGRRPSGPGEARSLLRTGASRPGAASRPCRHRDPPLASTPTAQISLSECALNVATFVEHSHDLHFIRPETEEQDVRGDREAANTFTELWTLDSNLPCRFREEEASLSDPNDDLRGNQRPSRPGDVFGDLG